MEFFIKKKIIEFTKDIDMSIYNIDNDMYKGFYNIILRYKLLSDFHIKHFCDKEIINVAKNNNNFYQNPYYLKNKVLFDKNNNSYVDGFRPKNCKTLSDVINLYEKKYEKYLEHIFKIKFFTFPLNNDCIQDMVETIYSDFTYLTISSLQSVGYLFNHEFIDDDYLNFYFTIIKCKNTEDLEYWKKQVIKYIKNNNSLLSKYIIIKLWDIKNYKKIYEIDMMVLLTYASLFKFIYKTFLYFKEIPRIGFVYTIKSLYNYFNMLTISHYNYNTIQKNQIINKDNVYDHFNGITKSSNIFQSILKDNGIPRFIDSMHNVNYHTNRNHLLYVAFDSNVPSIIKNPSYNVIFGNLKNKEYSRHDTFNAADYYEKKNKLLYEIPRHILGGFLEQYCRLNNRNGCWYFKIPKTLDILTKVSKLNTSCPIMLPYDQIRLEIMLSLILTLSDKERILRSFIKTNFNEIKYDNIIDWATNNKCINNRKLQNKKNNKGFITNTKSRCRSRGRSRGRYHNNKYYKKK